MRWITEAIGIVLCVQGVCGTFSALFDGGRSWLVVRHLLPEGAQVPAGVVIAVLGAVILLANARKRQDA